MRASCYGLAAVLLLGACASPDVQPGDECGPNSPCPGGDECTSTAPRRCVPKQGVVEKVELGVVIAGPGTVAIEGQTTCEAASCTYALARKASVKLTAVPAGDARFVAWSDGCTGTAPAVTFVLESKKSCVATFASSDGASFPVTLAAESGGSVSAGGGLTCGAGSCAGVVARGTRLTFTATAADGHRFAGWRGSADCDGKSESPLAVTVGAEVMCRAAFVTVHTIAVSTATPGAKVSVTAGACSGASCKVDDGASVTLSAGEVAGMRFAGWSGAEACAGTEATVTFLAHAPAACVASYLRRVTVAGQVGGELGGAVTATSPDAHAACAGASCTTDAGSPVTLVAPTLPGYRLTGWSGCQGVASGAGLTVTASQDQTCTASYLQGVSVAGTVVGAVGQVTASSPTPGASCSPGLCGLDVGGGVTLVAPDLAPGHRFLGWSGDPGCEGTGRTLTLSGVTTSVSCHASYVRRLTVTGDLQSGLLGQPGDIAAAAGDPTASCGAGACTVDAGQPVRLTAPDVQGYRFLRWSGVGCGAQQEMSVVPRDGDVACSARYVLRVRATATVAGATAAVLFASSAPAASCDAAGCTVDAGSDVTLNAPDLLPDHRFVGWSGGAGCAGPTRMIELGAVAADTACVATYVPRVKVSAASEQGIDGAPGIATSDPSGVCDALSCYVDLGQEVTLTAATVPGVRFLGWLGGAGCAGKLESPLTFAAAAPQTCTATYVQQVKIDALAAGGPGTVTVTAGACSAASCVVDKGAEVSLAAAPLDGYRFTGWSGDAPCVGAVTPLAFTVAAASTCTATYVHRYTVGGKVQDGLDGTITASADPPADCAGASCTVDAGRPVKLVASTITDYRLTGWTGCSGTAAGSGITVTAGGDATCTATYALGVSVSGTVLGANGTVKATSSSPGADCGDGSCSLDQGGSVTLESPDFVPGHRFKGWSGGTGCGTTALKITLDKVQSSVSCDATWVQRMKVSGVPMAGLDATITATSTDPAADCSTPGSCTVDTGKSVTLTALPVANHRFTGWSGTGCGSGNPLLVTPLTPSVTCTAQYALTVKVAATASGGGAPTLSATSTSAGHDCAAGTSCLLDAGGDVTLSTTDLEPAYRFKGWTGGTLCDKSTLVMTVTGAQASTTCDAGWVQRFKISGSAFQKTVTATSADPHGDCGTGSSCTVDVGQSVTLKAPDIENYRFTGWDLPACGTQQTTTIVASAKLDCVAQYVQQVTITATNGPGGTVKALDGATACPGNICTVDKNKTITLQVTPADATYRFTGWTLCSPTGGASPYSLVAAADITCKANFVKTYKITAAGSTGGTVTATSPSAPSQCVGNVCVVDQDVTVSMAVSSPGYRLTGWSSGCSPSGTGPYTLVNTNATCTASFVKVWSVTASNSAGGTVKAFDPGGAVCPGNVCGPIDDGKSVTFQVTPTDSTYRFTGWTLCSPTGNANPYSLAVTADSSCKANFVKTWKITATAETGGTVTATSPSAPAQCASNVCKVDQDVTVSLDVTIPDPTKYKWNGWKNCAPTGAGSPYTIKNVDADCTAGFLRQYTITGKSADSSMGTVTTSCGNQSCVVDPGVSVNLKAEAKLGYHFTAWNDPLCAPAGTPSIDLKDKDAACTAGFAADATYTAKGTAGTSGAGSVTLSAPAGTCAGDSCSGLPNGTVVTFTAGSNAGYVANGWSGCVNSGANPVTCTVSGANLAATASWRILVTGNTNGNGKIAGSTDAAGYCGSPSSSVVCTVAPQSATTFTVTPALGSYVESWSGPCTVDPTNRNVATIASTVAPGTCTANLAIAWATSTGHASGWDDYAAFVLDSGNGRLTMLGSTMASSAKSGSLWLQLLDPQNGEISLPLIVAGPFAGRGGGGLAQAGDDLLLLAASTLPGRVPWLAKTGPDGATRWAISLPWTLSGYSVGSDDPTGIALSDDGNFRVASSLNAATLQGIPLQVVRVSTVTSDGVNKGDAYLCDTTNVEGCTTACGRAVAGPMATAVGAKASYVTLATFPPSGSFTVALVADGGSGVKWARQVTVPGGGIGVPTAAASLPGGGVIITGYQVENVDTSGYDTFFLIMDQDGNGAGSSVGRASGATRLDEMASSVAVGPSGYLIGGAATDSRGAYDAWLLRLAPDGSIADQFAYGGDGDDSAQAAIPASGDGVFLAGMTRSFGGTLGDNWVLRTTEAGALPFTASSHGHKRPTNAVLGGMLNVAPNKCIQYKLTSQSASTAEIGATAVGVDFRRQAP